MVTAPLCLMLGQDKLKVVLRSGKAIISKKNRQKDAKRFLLVVSKRFLFGIFPPPKKRTSVCNYFHPETWKGRFLPFSLAALSFPIFYGVFVPPRNLCCESPSGVTAWWVVDLCFCPGRVIRVIQLPPSHAVMPLMTLGSGW